MPQIKSRQVRQTAISFAIFLGLMAVVFVDSKIRGD
jgi:hypothetical protein